MDIEQEARERHFRNRYSRTNRPLDSESEALGVAGEIAFAERILGIENFQPASKAPTSGYQFTIDGVWKIKIATSRRPGHLLVKKDKVSAMIYVLAGCRGRIIPENIYWVGWANESDVKRADVTIVKRGGNYVIPSHSIPADALDPLGTLCRLIAARGPEAIEIAATHYQTQAERVAQERAGTLPDDDSPDIQSALF